MSSSDERSPKRQRRSYSPASPPVTAATLKHTKPFVHPPHTPPSSGHMSPSWQSQQLPGLQQVANGGNVPTPPSTSGFHGHPMARMPSGDGGGGGESEQQTPAHELDVEQKMDGDGDAQMRDSQPAEGGEGDVSMAEDDRHRRTDHERQEGAKPLAPLPIAHPLCKLYTEPVPASQPHLSADLIGMYGLQRIQQSVARKDPVTGQKINKLRKSYEGKVKDLGLEGRNKAQKGQAELQGLLDPDWDQALPDGRTWWQAKMGDANLEIGGASDGAMLGMLSAAFEMKPGHLPPKEHEQWKTMLGFDDVASVKAVSELPPTAPSKVGMSNLLARTSPSATLRASAPASPRNLIGRPDRTNKKRRYDESSYPGYQEGYEDDGYSTGGMDDSSGRRGSTTKRQKRKDFGGSASNSPPFGAGGGSSIVGVRSS